jgi:hypothetical protein
MAEAAEEVDNYDIKVLSVLCIFSICVFSPVILSVTNLGEVCKQDCSTTRFKKDN